MRITHFSSSIDSLVGGTSSAVAALAIAQAGTDLDVGVISIDPAGGDRSLVDAMHQAGVAIDLVLRPGEQVQRTASEPFTSSPWLTVSDPVSTTVIPGGLSTCSRRDRCLS